MTTNYASRLVLGVEVRCVNAVTSEVGASQELQVVKNPPVNAGDAVSVPGVEDPLEEDMETNSNSLTWEIPWNVAESDMTEHTSRRVLVPCYKRGNGGLMSQWPDTPCDHLF